MTAARRSAATRCSSLRAWRVARAATWMYLLKLPGAIRAAFEWACSAGSQGRGGWERKGGGGADEGQHTGERGHARAQGRLEAAERTHERVPRHMIAAGCACRGLQRAAGGGRTPFRLAPAPAPPSGLHQVLPDPATRRLGARVLALKMFNGFVSPVGRPDYLSEQKFWSPFAGSWSTWRSTFSRTLGLGGAHTRPRAAHSALSVC